MGYFARLAALWVSLILLTGCTVFAATTGTRSIASEDEDCPAFTKGSDALAALREGRSSRPRSTAECFSKRYDEVKTPGADAEDWLAYLTEGAGFMAEMYGQVPAGSTARASYVDTEIKARAFLREYIVQMLKLASTSATRQTSLKIDYAKSVDYEANAIWRKSETVDQGLLELDRLLVDLDPTYLLSQTAKLWVEAVRTCPVWQPDKVKAVPDYKTSWCPAGCLDYFEVMDAKLKSWVKGKPEASVLLATKALERRAAEVKQFCGAPKK